LPPQLFHVISAAEDCVFEGSLDNARKPAFADYPEGDSLDRHIPPELFTSTAQLCESLDLGKLLPASKPWWVSSMLNARLLRRASIRFENGADRQLWDAAKSAGKRLFVLESVTDFFRAFDSLPLRADPPT
jgi:uncharacterized protein YbaP (TraB family)